LSTKIGGRSTAILTPAEKEGELVAQPGHSNVTNMLVAIDAFERHAYVGTSDEITLDELERILI
jgi:hypothetical protein